MAAAAHRLHPELLDYLGSVESLPESNPFYQMARDPARKCRDLICWAPDDILPMVHMLSPEVMALPTSMHPGGREVGHRGRGNWGSVRASDNARESGKSQRGR
jgi:hypothetical protein